MSNYDVEKGACFGGLEEAIQYAVIKHSGQVRKGTDIPYIVHPLEVMTLLAAMRAEKETVIAGVLHDTIEDTDATYEDISHRFGEAVANMVYGHSEDKSLSWQERKEYAIAEAASAELEMKKQILADKLSNMRAIHRDYMAIGDKLWERFNAGSEKQSWYYGGMTDALSDLAGYVDTREFYWEFVDRFKDVFVSFYIDDEEPVLYQQSADGEAYELNCTECVWKPASGKIPESAIQINRREAEFAEDRWKDDAINLAVSQDVDSGIHTLYCSPSRSLYIAAKEGEITFAGEDRGPECESVNGKDEYEFRFVLDGRASIRLAGILREMYGLTEDFGSILTDMFGTDDGSLRFTQFCIDNEIEYSGFYF